jgi:chorismate mutase-like protein
VTPAAGFPRMRGLMWGGSSAGRASRSQCEGREFDPPPLHQFRRRAVLLALLVACTRAWGAETPAGVLRIGTPGDYAPYAWHDTASGTWLGSDISLARALAASMGLRPQFVSTTWATLVADAKAGHFDIAVGGISITPERQRSVDFSVPFTSDRKQPVVRCGDESRFDTRDEINRPSVRLIVNAGGTNERFAREEFPAASLVVHADNRTVFEEIRAGRADVMVTDSVEGRLQQRAQLGLCVAKVRAKWAPASKAVLIAAGIVTRKDVDTALARLGGKRRYQRGLQDWESYPWAVPSATASQLAELIDERLSLVIEVARSKWNSKTAIEDLAREQQLLQSLRERARTLGVPASKVDAFFGAQIEAAKVLQHELFARWRKQKQGQFAGVADLARDIRPEIDRITSRMLDVLAMNAGNDSRLPPASTLSLVSPAAIKIARQGIKAASGT